MLCNGVASDTSRRRRGLEERRCLGRRGAPVEPSQQQHDLCLDADDGRHATAAAQTTGPIARTRCCLANKKERVSDCLRNRKRARDTRARAVNAARVIAHSRLRWRQQKQQQRRDCIQLTGVAYIGGCWATSSGAACVGRAARRASKPTSCWH